MPAEWETHAATWLGWPHNPTDWPDKLDTIRWVYGEMVRKISAGETIRMLVNSNADARVASRYLTRAGADIRRVEFVVHPTNRGWTRDSGPVFVRRNVERNLETAIVHFHFNAWAKYRDWQKDRKAPDAAAAWLGKRLFDAQAQGRLFILEGGGIDVNGHGTLLTTEECLLSKTQCRNPGMTRSDYEDVFAKYLGIEKVIWLGRGIAGDDTHGHVDDITRFVAPDTILTMVQENKKDENYRPLQENLRRLKSATDHNSNSFRIVELPMPAPVIFDGRRLPASYANFYIANGLVLVPVFNDPNDRIALNTLAGLFPKREVVGIYSGDFIWGFGALHCMTQQLPKASR
jgi:agmatine deiminase